MTSFLVETGNPNVPYKVIFSSDRIRDSLEDGSSVKYYLINKVTRSSRPVLKPVTQGAAVIRQVPTTQLIVDGQPLVE